MGHPMSPMADMTEKAFYGSVPLCHPMEYSCQFQAFKIPGKWAGVIRGKKTESKLGSSLKIPEWQKRNQQQDCNGHLN